jgi:hypothetical protein
VTEDNQLVQRIGYLPKDAPRQPGNYLATLRRWQGKEPIEGRVNPLQMH